MWQGLFSVGPERVQGHLYGPMTKEWKISGSEVGYIYPRAKMALVGEFKDNKMISGQKTDIKKVICHNNLLDLEFGEPKGKKFHFAQSTLNFVGDFPLERDPYEAETVEVKNSGISGSGEGLFALRNIKAKEIVAFYNGAHCLDEKEIIKFKRQYCEFDDDIKICKAYKILDLFGGAIFILPGLEHVNVYNATTGKLN